MLRNITADLYQIGECVSGEHGHEAVQVYVLMNNGHPILIDCGSHLYRSRLMQALENLLDGGSPAYIFLTHSELPHSGNLQIVADKWPDIRVFVSNVLLPYIELAPVLPLSQITTVSPGTVLDFDGRNTGQRLENSLDTFLSPVTHAREGFITIKAKSHYWIERRIVAQN